MNATELYNRYKRLLASPEWGALDPETQEEVTSGVKTKYQELRELEGPPTTEPLNQPTGYDTLLEGNLSPQGLVNQAYELSSGIKHGIAAPIIGKGIEAAAPYASAARDKLKGFISPETGRWAGRGAGVGLGVGLRSPISAIGLGEAGGELAYNLLGGQPPTGFERSGFPDLQPPSFMPGQVGLAERAENALPSALSSLSKAISMLNPATAGVAFPLAIGEGIARFFNTPENVQLPSEEQAARLVDEQKLNALLAAAPYLKLPLRVHATAPAAFGGEALWETGKSVGKIAGEARSPTEAVVKALEEDLPAKIAQMFFLKAGRDLYRKGNQVTAREADVAKTQEFQRSYIDRAGQLAEATRAEPVAPPPVQQDNLQRIIEQSRSKTRDNVARKIEEASQPISAERKADLVDVIKEYFPDIQPDAVVKQALKRPDAAIDKLTAADADQVLSFIESASELRAGQDAAKIAQETQQLPPDIPRVPPADFIQSLPPDIKGETNVGQDKAGIPSEKSLGQEPVKTEPIGKVGEKEVIVEGGPAEKARQAIKEIEREEPAITWDNIRNAIKQMARPPADARYNEATRAEKVRLLGGDEPEVPARYEQLTETQKETVIENAGELPSVKDELVGAYERVSTANLPPFPPEKPNLGGVVGRKTAPTKIDAVGPKLFSVENPRAWIESVKALVRGGKAVAGDVKSVTERVRGYFKRPPSISGRRGVMAKISGLGMASEKKVEEGARKAKIWTPTRELIRGTAKVTGELTKAKMEAEKMDAVNHLKARIASIKEGKATLEEVKKSAREMIDERKKDLSKEKILIATRRLQITKTPEGVEKFVRDWLTPKQDQGAWNNAHKALVQSLKNAQVSKMSPWSQNALDSLEQVNSKKVQKELAKRTTVEMRETTDDVVALLPEMKEFIDNIAGKSIHDMAPAEIKQLQSIVEHVAEMDRRTKEVIIIDGKGRRKGLKELKEIVDSDNAEMEKKSASRQKGGRVAPEQGRLEAVDDAALSYPEYIMKKFGTWGRKLLYDDVVEGVLKHNQIEKRGFDTMAEAVKDAVNLDVGTKEFDKWRQEEVMIPVESGEIGVSRGELVDLIGHAITPSNSAELLESGARFLKNPTAKTIQLNADTLQSLKNDFASERSIAEKMKEFFKVMAKEGNDVTEDLSGVQFYRSSDYYPRQKIPISPKESKLAKAYYRGTNPEKIKVRTGGGYYAISDAFDTMSRWTEGGHGLNISKSIEHSNARKFLDAVKEDFINRTGKDAWYQLNRRYEATMGIAPKEFIPDALIHKALSSFQLSLLKYRPSSAAVQIVSSGNFMQRSSPAIVAKAMLNVYSKPLNRSVADAIMKEGMFFRRYRSSGKNVVDPNNPIRDVYSYDVDAKGLKMLSKGDQAVAEVAYEIVRLESEARGEKVGDRELAREAAKRVIETQNADQPIGMSYYQLTSKPSVFKRLLTMFSSSSQKTYSVMRRSMLEYKDGKIGKGEMVVGVLLPLVSQALGAATIRAALSTMGLSAAAYLGFKTEPEEKKFQKLMKDTLQEAISVGTPGGFGSLANWAMDIYDKVTDPGKPFTSGAPNTIASRLIRDTFSVLRAVKEFKHPSGTFVDKSGKFKTIKKIIEDQQRAEARKSKGAWATASTLAGLSGKSSFAVDMAKWLFEHRQK